MKPKYIVGFIAGWMITTCYWPIGLILTGAFIWQCWQDERNGVE